MAFRKELRKDLSSSKSKVMRWQFEEYTTSNIFVISKYKQQLQCFHVVSINLTEYLVCNRRGSGPMTCSNELDVNFCMKMHIRLNVFYTSMLQLIRARYLNRWLQVQIKEKLQHLVMSSNMVSTECSNIACSHVNLGCKVVKFAVYTGVV